MKVRIPFKFRFSEQMLTGVKTATSRTKRYGNAGDTFDAFGREFELTDVYQDTLEVVAHDLWREEGCFASSHFEDVWRSIHPLKGFVPDQVVWVHKFKEKENDKT